jgi:hypothetical protein
MKTVTNFHLAPPAVTVDGLLAVPIDISTISAAYTFDAAARTAMADATITYEVGPTAGNPIFDLRQTPMQAWLDGAPFPVAQIAHHAFGTGSHTNLRVIESIQAAGSVHTLRVQYPLALPDSQLGGSYLPALDWSAGPRLRFVFGLSDLNRARYAEAWLPANLIYDQYAIELDIVLANTLVDHQPITNGTVTMLGSNHWRVNFPARFTALSPMLELRAADTLEQQLGTVLLPVSGRNVTIEAWKPVGSATDLATQITRIGNLLSENEIDYGAYAHGDRFVAFFNGSGGMEYEGAATTSVGALEHEVFHSWYARGLKPAAQADGWWDEGWANFHDGGADDPLPFDFGDPPLSLCTRDPWQRHTVANAYSDGSRFWQGMASLLGVPALNSLMAELYQVHRGRPLSTPEVEAFLLRRSGNVTVVDAFHRFVYGLPDGSPPDLWLRDAAGHGGADTWGGTFWDSPDLWVRAQDDGGTLHQSPESGQDNWFHARVRNRSGAGAAQHFAVTFHTRGFAGTQFSFPADFLPCIAAKVEFDLAPGAERIVKARWPQALVPAVGTHTCLLASVVARGDPAPAGRHVWRHNNLAQKNLTVVNLVPDGFVVLPVVVGRMTSALAGPFDLEVWRQPESAALGVSLLHGQREFFSRSLRKRVEPFRRERFELEMPSEMAVASPMLECGAPLATRRRHRGAVSASQASGPLGRYGFDWELGLPCDSRVRIPVELPPVGQRRVGLAVRAGTDAVRESPHKIHLVQRHRKSGRIVGGVALLLTVQGE